MREKYRKCKNCEETLEPGETIIVDNNGYWYCSELCIFEDYGLDYEEYELREDETSNYIDMGILDVAYIGSYDGSVD